jgi:hypothetical protein
MKATVYRNGKPETFLIDRFEIANFSKRNQYVNLFFKKEIILPGEKYHSPCITIDIKDLQEVSIIEDDKEDIKHGKG